MAAPLGAPDRLYGFSLIILRPPLVSSAEAMAIAISAYRAACRDFGEAARDVAARAHRFRRSSSREADYVPLIAEFRRRPMAPPRSRSLTASPGWSPRFSARRMLHIDAFTFSRHARRSPALIIAAGAERPFALTMPYAPSLRCSAKSLMPLSARHGAS